MNIGEASKRCGLPAKTIRYYESVGLIVPARSPNGYRDYRDDDVHHLRFLQRSRSLGFSIEDARSLLDLYAEVKAPCPEIARRIDERIAEIDRKIEALVALRQALSILAQPPSDGDRMDTAMLRDGPVFENFPE